MRLSRRGESFDGLYSFLNVASGYAVAWSFLFTGLTSLRILRRVRQGKNRIPDHPVLTELAGLPVVLLMLYGFMRGVYEGDWLSATVFAWYGPGFWITLLVLGVRRLQGRKARWPVWLRLAISVACKVSYVAIVLLCAVQAAYGMIFALSVWIINDQYDKAFLSLDTDRTRRSFDDYWLPRLAYPAGLLIPCFLPGVRYPIFSMIYGLLLLVLWALGVGFVCRKDLFFRRPGDTSLLRNMLYFPKD